MADKTIKHFVFSRFFPTQVPDYPHDVLDTDFLSAQIHLAKKNLLSSLENQTNKNFEVVFYANGAYFADPKYEFIFSTLKDSTTLPLKFIKGSEMSDLIMPAYNDYDFVIQSRIDFDDFIRKDIVEDTQSKVNECDKILGYGYCKGYTYFNKELYPFYATYKGRGHFSAFQSLILKSEFAKKRPFTGVYVNHVVFKGLIERSVNKNEFVESMFQQNTSTNAFIYFRHDTAWSNYKPGGNVITDITKKQLEEEFGFAGYELNSIK